MEGVRSIGGGGGGRSGREEWQGVEQESECCGIRESGWKETGSETGKGRASGREYLEIISQQDGVRGGKAQLR